MLEILLLIMLKGPRWLYQIRWIWLWNFGTLNIGLKVTSEKGGHGMWNNFSDF